MGLFARGLRNPAEETSAIGGGTGVGTMESVTDGGRPRPNGEDGQFRIFEDSCYLESGSYRRSPRTPGKGGKLWGLLKDPPRSETKVPYTQNWKASKGR